MNRKRIPPTIWFLILTFTLTACTLPAPVGRQSTPTPDPNQPVSSDDTPVPTSEPVITGETVAGVASVDSIQIAIAESFPVQVFVTARGNLPDGCTTIDRLETQFDGTTFNVTMTTIRPKDQACTEALVPFEENFPLEVAGLPAGKYTVIVNGMLGEFELAVDNFLPDQPTEEPAEATASIQGVVWHDICDGSGGEGCVEMDDGNYLADGNLDQGESGLAGVAVSIGAGACSQNLPSEALNSVTTGEQGNYSFTELPNGQYCVYIDPAANESILSAGSWTAPGPGGMVTIELASSETRLNVNFGWDFQLLPEPGETACTDIARFVKDVTVEDDSTFPAGQTFVKTWRLRNDGTCTWTGDYAIVFSSGDQMDAESPLPLAENVKPGDTVDISVTLIAPDKNGTYRGEWLLQNAQDQTFGLGRDSDEPFWVQIVVTELVSDLDLGPADWVDTFDNDDNWFMLNTSNVRWKVEDGQLEMRVLDAGGVEQWGLSNRPELGNFYLEATFKTGDKCSGLDRYGLLLRAPDPNEGYVLGVSCDGRYRLYKWDGQTYEALQDWKNDANILPGSGQSNKIGVWAKGANLKIYINSVLVAEFFDDTYSSGRFGLLAGSTNTEDLKLFVEEIAYWKLED